MNYYVYILASKHDGVLYVGITSNIVKRVYEHTQQLTDGFTQKYFIHRLVYFEIYEDSLTAISREKQLKHWKREWKIELIEKSNPEWKDLYNSLL